MAQKEDLKVAHGNQRWERERTTLASLGRSERRHHGSLYVQGLLLDGERKSIDPLAERLPGGNVKALQQSWDKAPGLGHPSAACQRNAWRTSCCQRRDGLQPGSGGTNPPRPTNLFKRLHLFLISHLQERR